MHSSRNPIGGKVFLNLGNNSNEYFDLETRIRNKQQQEARLLEHLEQDTGKLEDILAVEKEIGRVRTDIEISHDAYPAESSAHSS